MNVFDNLAFGLVQKSVPKKEINDRVFRMLDLVRLSGFEKRRIAEMSGGQQQRVALARALINEPQVLLLDEPMGSLDQKLRKQMQVELKRLQESLGITFVLVTHDQEEALALSDLMAVMNEGRIEQMGAPHEIYEFPKSRFVAEFIGATNLLEVSVLEVSPEFIYLKFNGTTTLKARKNGVPCTSGDRLEVSIRPERIWINRSAGEESDNVLEGKITDVMFLGDVTHYEIMINHDTHITAAQQNRSYGSGESPLAEGDHIYLHCKSDALRLVKT
jgi:ABC-type Fe3+/spermidine/putrescine transport system ATPase subunit